MRKSILVLSLKNQTTPIRRALHFGKLRGALALIVIVLAMISKAIGQTVPSDPQITQSVSASDFAMWFQAGSPSLNGVVNPANSLSALQPNFGFYAWSEQMFLWLTSPAPSFYGGGGQIFNSPTFYDVSPLDSSGNRTLIPHVIGVIRPVNLRAAQVGPDNLPMLFDALGRPIEVERAPLTVTSIPHVRALSGEFVNIIHARAGANGKAILLDDSNRVIEPFLPTKAAPPLEQAPVLPIRVQELIIDKIPIFLDGSGNVIEVEQGQADSSVLLSQNNSLVYYTTMVNDVYAYFLTGVADKQITPGTEFPTSQQDLNAIETFASAHGKSSFADAQALAVEVKASWVDASTLSDPNDYITMTATIPTYDQSNPAKWVLNGQKTAQLALVGIHVVGSVSGHTELVWATFEHGGNTPNATYSYINTSGASTAVNQNTAGTWLFCANNSSGPFNVAHNQLDPAGSGDILAVAPATTVSPSDTIRWKAWGVASDVTPNPIDGSPAAANSEIIAINNNIRGMLPSGDVRGNYIFRGATWTFGGPPTFNSSSQPTSSGNQVGTSQLANSTMETYEQGSDTTSHNLNSNCFMCHNPQPSTRGTSISHVFPALKPLF